MFKSLLACGILAASMGAQAGEALTAYCPNFNRAIIHMEHSEQGNQAEMVFEGGKFSIFDQDAGEWESDLRTIYKAKYVEKDGSLYTMHFSVYKNVSEVLVGIFKNDTIIGSDTCILVHQEEIQGL